MEFLLFQVIVTEMGKFLKRQAAICLSILLREILGTVKDIISQWHSWLGVIF